MKKSRGSHNMYLSTQARKEDVRSRWESSWDSWFILVMYCIFNDFCHSFFRSSYFLVFLFLPPPQTFSFSGIGSKYLYLFFPLILPWNRVEFLMDRKQRKLHNWNHLAYYRKKKMDKRNIHLRSRAWWEHQIYVKEHDVNCKTFSTGS